MKIIRVVISLTLLIILLSCSKSYGYQKKKDYELYTAVYSRRIEKVKELLANGSDPDYCTGEAGWVDSNPLNVVAESFYGTYYRHHLNKKIPDPAPDVVVLEILVEYGANIKERPYIWDRVDKFDNDFYDRSKGTAIIFNKRMQINTLEEHFKTFVNDSNRLIKAFLEAGADPDFRGHPYPFSYKAISTRMTDEKAEKYFAKGSRAINIAIEKGMGWESQVDLLLEYTTLDKESLEAAERSNDPLMIRKINELWDKGAG